MSSRPPSRPLMAQAGAAEGHAFDNPWARCWGSCETSDQVAQMSSDASSPRQMAQMTGEAGATPPEPAAGEDMLSRVLPIINQRGLHARASAKFVQTAERFQAEITVSRGGETVGGGSIMGLMMLAAARGTSITVAARGPDAEAALDAIEALVASRFGEEV